MTNVSAVKNKKHQVTEILVTFSGALNAGEATNIAEYELITAGKGGSFTAKHAKVIKLRSAAYNSANNTVTLTPRKNFALRKATELIVNGEPPSGLEDSRGLHRRQGQWATRQQRGCHHLSTNGAATINALSGGPAAVDQLVELGELAALAKPRRS